MVQFLPLAPSGQTDPRLLLAQGLLGGNRQASTPGQGIVSALSSVLGGFLAKRAFEAQEGQQEQRSQSLAEALQLATGRPAETVTQPPGAGADITGGAIDFNAQPPNRQGAFQALGRSGDPQLQRFALAQALAPQSERFTTATGPGGTPVQISSTTGREVASPRAQTAKFQTDLGKTFADQKLAADVFGKDSPQAAAFTELAKSEQTGEPIDLTDEGGQRKEFTKASGDFVKIRDSFGKIQTTAKDSSAAGDVALIFNFMRMNDPASTVREGEFATAEQTGGVPDRLVATYNRLISGERLSEAQRQDFLNQSGALFSSQKEQQDLLETQFRSVATRSGLRPENVVIDFQGRFRSFGEGGAAQTVGLEAGPSAAPPPTALNSLTGEILVWDGQKWVPQ